MHEERYTRCPGCRTIFRVTPEQLAIREGQVRCGHCKTVFDGNACMISLAPQPRPGSAEGEADEAALGPPTVTLRSAQALQPAVSVAAAQPAAAATLPGEEIDEIAYEERFAWSKRKKKRGARTALWVGAVPLLVLLLAGQVAIHYRDWIGAHWPASKPVLAQLCAPFGCAVRPLRDIDAVSIEASELQADPAHKGLLILSATIRNRAPWAVAYPHLELTLTDTQDRAVVRRGLAPAEYAARGTSVDAGIPPRGDVQVRLYIDASATSQSGYRVFLLYP
jgi:predicted Zn finger-like uncharacterized protein